MNQKKSDGQAVAYKAPEMVKHDPVKVVQGTATEYCYYYYSYYYRTIYYYCYYV